MAPEDSVVSFDDFIKAGRAQREKQKLADEIFGQGRKNNSLGNGSRKLDTVPSLASRVGVSKPSQRSNSNTPRPKPDIDGQWGHDLHRSSISKAPRVTRPPRDNLIARQLRNDLLLEAAAHNGTITNPESSAFRASYGEEISIRGIAGPYVVIGSNFAPGTTAADIESAMVPSGAEMQSCRIMSASPTVIAEMVFAEKHNADTVISTFNNKKADGRILHVYLKAGGSSLSPAPTANAKATPPPQKPSDIVDLTKSETISYAAEREQSDRARRRADPEIQDGRYGFDAKEDIMDVDMDAKALVTSSTAPASANASTPRIERREERRDYGRRDYRPVYDSRRNYYGREDRWDYRGRQRDDRRLYSDSMYDRSGGRGYR